LIQRDTWFQLVKIWATILRSRELTLKRELRLGKANAKDAAP
jgi:hypothetical protein